MIKHTRITALTLALVLALVVGACGSSDTSEADTAASTIEPTPTEIPTTLPVTVEPVASDTSTDDSSDDEAASEPPTTAEPEETAEPEPTAPPEPPPAASPEPEPTTADTAAPAVEVANDSYLGDYTLVDEEFGTMVIVSVDGDIRTIGSNTLPNHETGDFPNQGNPNTITEQDRTWELTTAPTYSGQARTVRETGVALNGVKFEPGTGETVSCTSGEQYRIEGLQDTFDLGMDFNLAHVQPTGEYHYHGVSPLLVEAFDSDADLVLVGFAADGHLMYYSKSSAYDTSYTLSTEIRTGTDCTYRDDPIALDGTTPDGTYVSDWQYVEGLGDLDECNGTFIDGEYAYVVTEEYPYIPRCLMGEFVETGPGGAGGGAGGPGAGGEGPGQGGPTGPPDLDAAAARLGIPVEELEAALGTPPPDLGAAAETLGITVEALEAALFG